MSSQQIEDGVGLLRAEFLDSPDMSLSAPQVSALLECDRPTTLMVLEVLKASGFLERAPDGRFVLAPRFRPEAEPLAVRW